MPASAAPSRSISTRSIVSRALGPLVVLAILASTQWFVSVPAVLSIGGTQRLDLSEMLFGVLTLIVLARLTIFGDYARLDRTARFLLWSMVVTGIIWATLTVVRYLVTAKLVVSITVMEYLVFALVAYLAARLGWVGRRAMMDGAIAFYTAVNLVALGLVAFKGMRVRGSDLLGNANIYVAMVMLLSPVLLQYAAGRASALRNLLVLTNVGVGLAMVLLSGSRFALVMVPAELIIFFLFTNRARLRAQRRNILILAAATLGLATLLLAINPQLIADLDRARSGEETVSAEPRPTSRPTASLSTHPSASPLPSGTVTEAPQSSPSASPTPTPPSSDPATERTESTDPTWEEPYAQPELLTHSRIFARSMAVLSEHWLWGTGRSVIFFDGWGFHPPHNLFLELLVYFGVFGTVPYLMVCLHPPVAGLRRLGIRGVLRSGFLIGYVTVLGYSLFQPLITDQLILLLLSWGIFGALSGPGRTDWRGVMEP